MSTSETRVYSSDGTYLLLPRAEFECRSSTCDGAAVRYACGVFTHSTEVLSSNKYFQTLLTRRTYEQAQLVFYTYICVFRFFV